MHIKTLLSVIKEKSVFEIASLINEHRTKKPTFKCMIVNAKSGACPHDCNFCAQSSHWDTGAPVYDLLSKERLIETGLKVEDAGIDRYSIVTSGASPSEKELDTICEVVSILKERTNIFVDASLGALTINKAKRLKQAGLDRYHHNLETARSFYPNISTTQSYDDKIETLLTAREAGLEICTGGIFGMGETWEQRLEMFNEINELSPKSVPINLLVPILGTPFGNKKSLRPVEALKILALASMVIKNSDIIIAGGRPNLGYFQSWLLLAGITGMMVGDYLTTSGESLEEDLKRIKIMEELNGIYTKED